MCRTAWGEERLSRGETQLHGGGSRARRTARRASMCRNFTPHRKEGPFLKLRYIAAATLTVTLFSSCETTTSKLSSDQVKRFEAEGITRSADDIVFRFTRDAGGRSERREDRRASIVVTRQSVLIHKNDKVGVEVTPRTRRDVSVQRSGNRIRIRTGSGRSEEIWSFEPPDDAAGWASDIRNVIQSSETREKRN